VIEISCQNIKLDAMWAGEWQSTWTLQDETLSGNLKVKTHYFEMGNMQMSLDKDFDSVAVKDAANAKEIIKAIKKAEDKYQDELEEMYKNI
jgi:enoyl reductase-like protein